MTVDSTFLEAKVKDAVADKGHHRTKGLIWCQSFGIHLWRLWAVSAAYLTGGSGLSAPGQARWAA